MVASSGGKWYFGWNIVAVATLVTLLTVGMRMGIGPFFLPMAEDLGYSRSLLAGIVAIGMLCYGLGMPVAGHLVARRGTPFVLLLGTAIVIVSIIWTVYARHPVSFLLAFGVLMSFGLALTSPVAFTPVISHWLLTPILTYSIAAVGWQGTLLGYAALFAVLIIPMAMFVVRDEAPPEADLSAEDIASKRARAGGPAMPVLKLRDAVRTAPFWKISFGLFTCGYSMNLIGTHGIPMLMDHGFDSGTSALGIGLIGLVAIFSTLVLGRLSDVLPRRHILAAIYLVRGLGFFGLLMAGTHWELYGVSTIGGIAWAGSIALSSAILADVYGVRLVGILYGLAYLSHQIGAMISSWLGGWAYEAFGTHWVSFGSAGGLLLVAAGVALLLPVQGFSLRQAPA